MADYLDPYDPLRRRREYVSNRLPFNISMPTAPDAEVGQIPVISGTVAGAPLGKAAQAAGAAKQLAGKPGFLRDAWQVFVEGKPLARAKPWNLAEGSLRDTTAAADMLNEIRQPLWKTIMNNPRSLLGKPAVRATGAGAAMAGLASGPPQFSPSDVGQMTGRAVGLYPQSAVSPVRVRGLSELAGGPPPVAQSTPKFDPSEVGRRTGVAVGLYPQSAGKLPAMPSLPEFHSPYDTEIRIPMAPPAAPPISVERSRLRPGTETPDAAPMLPASARPAIIAPGATVTQTIDALQRQRARDEEFARSRPATSLDSLRRQTLAGRDHANAAADATRGVVIDGEEFQAPVPGGYMPTLPRRGLERQGGLVGGINTNSRAPIPMMGTQASPSELRAAVRDIARNIHGTPTMQDTAENVKKTMLALASRGRQLPTVVPTETGYQIIGSPSSYSPQPKPSQEEIAENKKRWADKQAWRSENLMIERFNKAAARNARKDNTVAQPGNVESMLWSEIANRGPDRALAAGILENFQRQKMEQARTDMDRARLNQEMQLGVMNAGINVRGQDVQGQLASQRDADERAKMHYMGAGYLDQTIQGLDAQIAAAGNDPVKKQDLQRQRNALQTQRNSLPATPVAAPYQPLPPPPLPTVQQSTQSSAGDSPAKPLGMVRRSFQDFVKSRTPQPNQQQPVVSQPTQPVVSQPQQAQPTTTRAIERTSDSIRQAIADDGGNATRAIQAMRDWGWDDQTIDETIRQVAPRSSWTGIGPTLANPTGAMTLYNTAPWLSGVLQNLGLYSPPENPSRYFISGRNVK